LAGLPIIA